MAEITEKQSERKASLLKLAGDHPVAGRLVDEIVFLETNLDELRGLPMIRRNPSDPMQAKPTQTAKLYKELLQQYINAVKAFEKLTGAEEEEPSLLREYLASFGRDAVSS